MEESPPPQSLTLNPSETAYSFPPHRRRPLRSRTYGALIRILSHCTSLPHPQKQADSGDSESKPVTEENGSIARVQDNSADVLVPLPNSNGSKDTVVQKNSNDEIKENIGQDGGFDGVQATIPELHQMDLVTTGEQEVTPSNRISVEDLLDVENEAGDCAIQNAKEQENSISVFDIDMDDFEVDKEFCVSHLNEILGSCFGTGMVVESSKPGQDSQEKGAVLENMPKDAEHELQLKEMELEKLIHNSGGAESSFHLNTDEDIEEGEISGEAGVADESFDALSDDVVSLGERATQEMHASECYLDKEELFCKDEDRGHLQHEISDPSLVNIVNTESNSMEMESRTPAGQMQDFHAQNVPHDSHTETQRSNDITLHLENLTPSARILQENAAENQTSFTTKKDDDASKKKRKRGPLTKEKRAKKKKKERLKRAEKNRELGVKRLKLQTVLKPKTIVYCRHYLQGRCHEGEKCKFSHDTVPLTKSKPCGHFARGSCMKGDECPFDHELSKYPCKNYTSTGFCNRGSECLFSHEMPAKSCSLTPEVSKPDLMSAQQTVSDRGGSNPLSKVTKPELKFPSPLNYSNSSKHMDDRGLQHQKVDTKFCSASNSHVQSAELQAAKPVPTTSRQAPKGVSFLLNGGMSLGDTNKDKRDESSKKTPDGVDVGSKSILKVPSGINKLNGLSEGVATRKPRGINFLSFGPPSADDSSSKIFSNLLSNCNDGTGKSVIDDMSEGKHSCSLPSSGGILNANRQMNQSAASLTSNLNEKVTETLLAVPQHVNFLSFNRNHLDDSISKEKANPHFENGDTALSFAKERQGTSKLQDTINTPSFSFGGLWDQSTGRQNANVSSSFEKSHLSDTPSVVQKAVQSTLAFAAKLEPDIKVGSSLHRRES